MNTPSGNDYMHGLDIALETRANVAVARITGNVDAITADELLARLEAAIEEGHVRLVGDLSGVSYTSSAGLRAMLAAMKQTRRRGGDFRLAGVNDRVRKVLELSGFTSILRLYPDVDAAVESFSA
jgi:anti-sigma B factor antagonist